MLIQDRPRVTGPVKDILLHLHHEWWNLKWAPEILVFIFNVSNCWWHCRAPEGCFLNGTRYLYTPQQKVGSEKRYPFQSWRQETESVCSLTTSMWIHVVQLPSLQIFRAGGCGCYWYYLTVTLSTTDFVYWWEQVLHAKNGEYEEDYCF